MSKAYSITLFPRKKQAIPIVLVNLEKHRFIYTDQKEEKLIVVYTGGERDYYYCKYYRLIQANY